MEKSLKMRGLDWFLVHMIEDKGVREVYCDEPEMTQSWFKPVTFPHYVTLLISISVSFPIRRPETDFMCYHLLWAQCWVESFPSLSVSELRFNDCRLLEQWNDKEESLQQLVSAVKSVSSLHTLSLAQNRIGKHILHIHKLTGLNQGLWADKWEI